MHAPSSIRCIHDAVIFSLNVVVELRRQSKPVQTRILTRDHTENILLASCAAFSRLI